MRTDNTVPILDRTTGSHCPTPSLQQASCLFAPCWVHRLQQVLGLLTQNSSTLPGPADESHGLFAQLGNGFLLKRFQLLCKVQQSRQTQAHLRGFLVAALCAGEAEPTAPLPPTSPARLVLHQAVRPRPGDGAGSPERAPRFRATDAVGQRDT